MSSRYSVSQHLHVIINALECSCWQRSIAVTSLGLSTINEVTLRQAWLVLGWVTD